MRPSLHLFAAVLYLAATAATAGAFQEMAPVKVASREVSFLDGLYCGVLSMILLLQGTRGKLIKDSISLTFIAYLAFSLLHLAAVMAWPSTGGSLSSLPEAMDRLALAAGGLFWSQLLGLAQRAPRAARFITCASLSIGATALMVAFDVFDLGSVVRMGALLVTAVAAFEAFSPRKASPSVSWETKAALAIAFTIMLKALISGTGPEFDRPWASSVWPLAAMAQMVLFHFAIARRYENASLQADQRKTELETEAREKHARWLSVVTHEIKTPLSVIDSAASSIESLAGVGDERVEKRCRKIQRSVTQINSLLTHYVAEDRLLGGFTELDPQPVDVGSFMERIVRGVLLPTEPKIDFALDLSEAPEEIYADRLLLQLMLNNLLANAVKYSPDGGTIDVRVRHAERRGISGTEIDVEDPGTALQHDELSRLFDEYLSGDERLKSDDGSNSLSIGFWAVRESVRKHRGEIQVQSSPSQGCRFNIWLPDLVPEAA